MQTRLLVRRDHLRAFATAIGLLALVGSGARSQDRVPEPAGYRLNHYRAPTPATLAGARVLTTAEAELCWKNGAVFVDVLHGDDDTARITVEFQPSPDR